jgi:hypothetical protein
MVMGYPVPYATNAGREYVQTSPLGLAGWRPNQANTGNTVTNNPPIATASTVQPQANIQPSPNDDLLRKFGDAAVQIDSQETIKAEIFQQPVAMSQDLNANKPVGDSTASCKQCNAAFEPEARFCMRCGAAAF